MQAVEAARTAAKNISETVAEDSESTDGDGKEEPAVEEESDDENDKRRKEALDKLEKASEESLLSQVGHVKFIYEMLFDFFSFLCPFSTFLQILIVHGHLFNI